MRTRSPTVWPSELETLPSPNATFNSTGRVPCNGSHTTSTIEAQRWSLTAMPIWPPNAIVINKANGHAHALTLLATPVAKHSAARSKPLAYLAAVERGMARRLGADRAYTGLIAKNPLHDHWEVEWRREEPYSLPELDDWLFKRDMRPDSSVTTTYGFSRNCTCFDKVREIAYREVLDAKRAGKSLSEFQARLERVALEFNLHFPEALPLSEIRAIAKSVSKWTWRNFSPERLSRASVDPRQARQR